MVLVEDTADGERPRQEVDESVVSREDEVENVDDDGPGDAAALHSEDHPPHSSQDTAGQRLVDGARTMPLMGAIPDHAARAVRAQLSKEVLAGCEHVYDAETGNLLKKTVSCPGESSIPTVALRTRGKKPSKTRDEVIVLQHAAEKDGTLRRSKERRVVEAELFGDRDCRDPLVHTEPSSAAAPVESGC